MRRDRPGVPSPNFRIILCELSYPVVGLPLADRGSGFCSTCNHLCAYTLSKGRMVHNLMYVMYEPRKEESDDPGDVSCDRRYRHHRVVLRYRHPVVVVDARLWAPINRGAGVL